MEVARRAPREISGLLITAGNRSTQVIGQEFTALWAIRAGPRMLKPPFGLPQMRAPRPVAEEVSKTRDFSCFGHRQPLGHLALTIRNEYGSALTIS